MFLQKMLLLKRQLFSSNDSAIRERAAHFGFASHAVNAIDGATIL